MQIRIATLHLYAGISAFMNSIFSRVYPYLYWHNLSVYWGIVIILFQILEQKALGILFHTSLTFSLIFVIDQKPFNLNVEIKGFQDCKPEDPSAWKKTLYYVC